MEGLFPKYHLLSPVFLPPHLGFLQTPARRDRDGVTGQPYGRREYIL